MRSHVGWGGETFFIRMWKLLPSIRILKTLRESPNRTISARGGLGLLQMVLESGTGQCANKEAEPRKGWSRDGVPAKTLSPEGGGL